MGGGGGHFVRLPEKSVKVRIAWLRLSGQSPLPKSRLSQA
jgi:hypothetical protein